jgi:hypothetical protein
MWVSRILLCVTLLLFLLGGPATAAQLDPALQQELLALYDRYGAGGDREGVKKKQESAGRSDRNGTANGAEQCRGTARNHLRRRHGGGDSRACYAYRSRQRPYCQGPKPGTVLHAEVTLKFKQEDKQWRLDEQQLGLDPANVKPCSDEAIEPTSNYDDNRQLSPRGMIRKIDFKPDRTLLVVRIMDEDNCAILPIRAKLIELGMDVSKVVPYAAADMIGSPHRSDNQRTY